MFIGNVVLVFMNMPMVPYIAKLLALPQRLLIPVIMCLAFMGTYMMNYSAFDFPAARSACSGTGAEAR